MPVLDGKYFGGGGDLPQDLVNKLSAADLQQAACATLTALGWEGQMISAVGLIISPDGELVHSAQFAMKGPLATGAIPVKISNVWEKAAKDMLMHITLPDSGMFQFTGGELNSEYLDQSAAKVSFTKEDRTLAQAEWGQNGIGEFSLRLVVHLDKGSNSRAGPHFRCSVMLYPMLVSELRDLSDATQSVAWPGIRILEGKSEFFPRPPASFWGCPLLPLLVTHLRARTCNAVPKGEKLRHAIAQLMASAALPNVCTTRAGVKRRMAEAQAAPDELEPLEPIVTWPPAPEPEAEEGKIILYTNNRNRPLACIICLARQLVIVFHIPRFQYASLARL